MDEQTLWTGHIKIVKNTQGKTQIFYLQDDTVAELEFDPSGFFENKALNSLIKDLQKR